MSGARAILRWARETPEATAVVEGANAYAYAQAARHLAGFVQALEARGVAPGGLVGLQCASRYLRLMLSLACEVLGAPYVALAAEELTPEAPMTRRCAAVLAEQAGALPEGVLAVRLDADFVAGALAAPLTEADLDRLAVAHPPATGVRIARTSGTTGAAKSILKTRAIIDGALGRYKEALAPIAGPYTYLCPYGTEINGIYTDAIRALKFGNRILFVSELSQILDLPDPGRAYAFLLPREAQALSRRCRDLGRRLGLYYVDVTGAGLSDALRDELADSLSPTVQNVYSSNEAPLIAARAGAGLYAILPQVEVKIVDDQWTPLPPGAHGLIAVRSPYVADGYLWDPEQTARSFREGWFLMGDFGHLPGPGMLAVLARADDLLNIGGEKIAPGPVEQALRTLAGVEDAALLRREGETGIGALCVAIERPAGGDDAALTAAVAQLLGSRFRAFTLHLDAAFPRTETGKVRRSDLLARVEAKGG